MFEFKRGLKGVTSRKQLAIYRRSREVCVLQQREKEQYASIILKLVKLAVEVKPVLRIDEQCLVVVSFLFEGWSRMVRIVDLSSPIFDHAGRQGCNWERCKGVSGNRAIFFLILTIKVVKGGN